MTQVKKNNVLQSKSDYNARGELARLSDSAANQVTTYSYDLIGRPVQSTTSLTVGGNSRVIQSSFRYDTLNRLTAQDDVMPRNGAATDPRVGDFNYIYGTTGNASGLIERVQMHKVNRLSYQYDSLGRVTRRTYSTANKNTDYTYVNVSGLRTSSLVESVNNAGETLSYTYDSMGNISTIKKDGVLRESYQYDALGQLTRVDSAVQNKSFVYTYDAGGNLTAVKEYAYTTGTLGAVQNTVAYSYGNSNWKDLLTSYDGQSITYDAIGNPLTYRDGMSMTWSGRNLTGLTKDGQSISYAYDANGLRASKTVDGNTTTYYTSGGVKIGEYRAGTNTDVFYMHDEKGTIYGICINGTTYLFVYNAQGDVIALYDNAGNVHARYTYDAWGKPLTVTDGSGNDVSGNPNHVANINPFRYRNYYYDTETGFYYLNSRYYDPQTGRFINPDGVIAKGSSPLLYNLFIYCKNNPINFKDDTGFLPEWMENAWNSVKQAWNQFTEPFVKIGQSIHTIVTSFKYQASVGTGFKIGGAAAGISGSMGVKTDILQIRANRNGIDLGQEMSYGCSLSVPEMPGFSVSTTQGYYHSYFCDQYSKAPGHNENKWSCPNTEVYDGQLAVDDFTIIGIDAYCGIGFSASVSFDTDYAAEELTQIWYNWEYWG